MSERTQLGQARPRHWLASAVCCFLLCLAVWSVTPGRAQPQAGKQPFQNSVAQRNDMLRELREIKALLKEQNAILRKQAANN